MESTTTFDADENQNFAAKLPKSSIKVETLVRCLRLTDTVNWFLGLVKLNYLTNYVNNRTLIWTFNNLQA